VRRRLLAPTGWHEIKHDGYRMLVRREGGHVRLYSRKAIDWTDRLPAIAAGAALLKAKSFTIDGEAVVIRSVALGRRRRGAAERRERMHEIGATDVRTLIGIVRIEGVEQQLRPRDRLAIVLIKLKIVRVRSAYRHRSRTPAIALRPGFAHAAPRARR
jgi:hypothetical protein